MSGEPGTTEVAIHPVEQLHDLIKKPPINPPSAVLISPVLDPVQTDTTQVREKSRSVVLRESQESSEPDFSKYSKEWRKLGNGTYVSEYEQARFAHALSSVAPEILKEMESGKGQLFARWSPDIEADKQPGKVSKALFGNWFQRKEPIAEAGISVSNLDKNLPNFGLYLKYSMAGAFGFEPRKLYILRAKPVDHGLDSELVVEPSSIKPVLTVPYESKILEDFPELKYYDPKA